MELSTFTWCEFAIVLELQLNLPEVASRDLSSMAYHEHLIATGSQDRVSILDPRISNNDALIARIDSPDPGYGVRSVSITNSLLTFGTGRGKMVFFDTRTWNVLPTMTASTGNTTPPPYCRYGNSGSDDDHREPTTRNELSQEAPTTARTTEQSPRQTTAARPQRMMQIMVYPNGFILPRYVDVLPNDPLPGYNDVPFSVAMQRAINRTVGRRGHRPMVAMTRPVDVDGLGGGPAANGGSASSGELLANEPVLDDTSEEEFLEEEQQQQQGHSLFDNEHTPHDYLLLGTGSTIQDQLYWDFFSNDDICHACYAHAWDESGNRLFACGGPLSFGLKGRYVAIWE